MQVSTQPAAAPGVVLSEGYVQMPLARQQTIVIVMLTTSLHPVDLAQARQLPIASFLNKPLTKEKVAALLAQHFPSLPQ